MSFIILTYMTYAIIATAQNFEIAMFPDHRLSCGGHETRLLTSCVLWQCNIVDTVVCFLAYQLCFFLFKFLREEGQ